MQDVTRERLHSFLDFLRSEESKRRNQWLENVSVHKLNSRQYRTFISNVHAVPSSHTITWNIFRLSDLLRRILNYVFHLSFLLSRITAANIQAHFTGHACSRLSLQDMLETLTTAGAGSGLVIPEYKMTTFRHRLAPRCAVKGSSFCRGTQKSEK